MHLPRFANRLALLGAFLLCISLGFGLALVLKERLSSTAEADPCFGHGQLVEKSQRQVTQQEIDSIKGSAPQLADVPPGLREFRKCRSGPGFVVVVDDTGHVWDSTQPSPDELKSYYATHPAENPQNQLATVEAKDKQQMYVTPALPDPDAMANTVLAGCDPSWKTQDLSNAHVRICYPADSVNGVRTPRALLTWEMAV